VSGQGRLGRMVWNPVFWAAFAALATLAGVLTNLPTSFDAIANLSIKRSMQDSDVPEVISCKQLGEVRSLQSVGDANINIENNRNEYVNVVWINFQGEVSDDKYNFRLPAKDTSYVRTTYRHVFMVSDRFGQCITLLRAKDSKNQTIIIQ
jgi:hypothetical protein